MIYNRDIITQDMRNFLLTFIVTTLLIQLPSTAQDVIQRPGGGRAGESNEVIDNQGSAQDINLHLQIPQLDKYFSQLNNAADPGVKKEEIAKSPLFFDSIINDVYDIQNAAKKINGLCECEIEWERGISRFATKLKTFLESLKQNNTNVVSLQLLESFFGDLNFFEKPCTCDIEREKTIKDIKIKSELLLKKVESLKY